MTERADRIGDLHLGAVVVNVESMERAVGFWTATLGYVTRDPEPDPLFTQLIDPQGRGLPISLQLTDRAGAHPARIHIDLYTEDQSGQVERLLALGASHAEGWPYPEDADFVVLRDP
ncbi:MAG TPA: VOC family protein, partial [Candidatus Dormibacteraeota bacterium]|nr:VOC family protein [Candidatus Dormibacteraeota bacterium]